LDFQPPLAAATKIPANLRNINRIDSFFQEKCKVIRCYSTGKPTGTSTVGGLVGYKDSGSGYENTGNFWNTETSEINTSAMGTGKTTPQMKALSTFTSAGWDFVTVWAICEGTSYPRLIWQIPEADWVYPAGVSTEGLNYFVGRWLF
jgi:hypothetical protein